MKTLQDFKDYINAVVFLSEKNIGFADNIDHRTPLKSDSIVLIADKVMILEKNGMEYK